MFFAEYKISKMIIMMHFFDLFHIDVEKGINITINVAIV